MPVKVGGTKKALAVLRAGRDVMAGGDKMMRPLELELGKALSEIQRQAIMLTPISKGGGTLRGSAKNETFRQGPAIRGRITFGGMASKYAEVQHEREDFNHPRGGTHHFLYGAEHSAWDANHERVKAILQQRTAAILAGTIHSANTGPTT